MFVVVTIFLFFFVTQSRGEEKACECGLACDDAKHNTGFVESIKCPSFPQLVLQPHETEIVFDVAPYFTGEEYIFIWSIIFGDEVLPVSKTVLSKFVLDTQGFKRGNYTVFIHVIDITQKRASNMCLLSLVLMEEERRAFSAAYTIHGGDRAGKCLHYPPSEAILIDSGNSMSPGTHYLWKHISGPSLVYQCDPQGVLMTRAMINIAEPIMGFVPGEYGLYEFEFLVSDDEGNFIERKRFQVNVYEFDPATFRWDKVLFEEVAWIQTPS